MKVKEKKTITLTDRSLIRKVQAEQRKAGEKMATQTVARLIHERLSIKETLEAASSR